jgi:hypothetical protein
MKTHWMTRPHTRSAVTVLLALALPACADAPTGAYVCTPGAPVSIDYTAQGSFTTTSLNLSGLTVTGSDTVNVLQYNGLGVIGGLDAFIVDGTESVRFAVNAGAAVDVQYWLSQAGNLDEDALLGEATIEAFDHSGVSLGTQTIDGMAMTIDVSALFGEVPISAFVTTADVDYFMINTATYTPCQ